MEWEKKYDTGIKQIDEHHMEFMAKIDQLELAIYRGKSTAELIAMMEFLKSYIIEHFNLEEKLMLDNYYPGFAAHAHQHSEFRTAITEILENLKARGTDSYLAIEIDKRLRKWLENHILKTDMEYIPYIKK